MSENKTPRSSLHISIIDEGKLISEVLVDSSKIVIGRILSADFRVLDRRISRIHALLERVDDNQVRLTDLASTHGTFVNGERIVERIIGPQDKIQLANLEMRIRFVGNAEYQSRVPTPVEKTIVEEVKDSNPAPVQAKASSVEQPAQINVGQQVGEAVKISKEATVIRSLKATARDRGVLESGRLSDELEVTVYWEDTVLNVDHYGKTKRAVSVGSDKDNDYVLKAAGLPPKFPLFKVDGNEVEVSLNQNIKGSARSGGVWQNFKELNEKGHNSVRLRGHDIAKIQVGNVNFFLMFVARPPVVPRAPFFDQGKKFWGLLFTFLAIFLAIGFLISQYKPTIDGDVKEFPERFKRILVKNIKIKKIVPVQKNAGTNSKTQKKVTKTGGNEGGGARNK